VFGIDRTPNKAHTESVDAIRGLDGVQALGDAVASVGLGVEVNAGDSGVDLILRNPAGGFVAVEVKRLSLASVEALPRRLADWSKRLPPETVGVLVADRVTADARNVLSAAGWGWLDLRGHLHLAGAGLFVDVDVPALRATHARSNPLAGRVGLEVASLLLLNPDQPAAVRQIAGTLGRAASSVSEVLTSMRTAGLLDEDRRPTVPELFWELARRWSPPAYADVQAVPSPSTRTGGGTVDEALRLGFQDVEATTGWALTDTMGAAAYGAPVGVRSDYPPDFYVPDEATLRRAVHLLGAARDRESRSATVRVAPVPLVCARRVDAPNETWPLAQPLFVALDLAQDPGRGREVLEGWNPPDGTPRVW
jgi:hypothetical protein